jgi:hypothetical protein
MLKDILRIALKNKIILQNGQFIYKGSKVTYSEFMLYVNKNRFLYGLDNTISDARQELFKINK